MNQAKNGGRKNLKIEIIEKRKQSECKKEVKEKIERKIDKEIKEKAEIQTQLRFLHQGKMKKASDVK